MGGDDERALVSRLKRGDEAAFDALYERYRPRLFSFLARLTQQRDLAEDLLQETWLRLARNAAGLRDDTDIGAWLFTVARNLHRSQVRWMVVDLDRRRWLKRTREEGIENTSPFDLTATGELQRRLERALALLPLKYREVVLLVIVEQLSHEEASRVIGIAPPALRQRLARARARLAVELQAEPGETRLASGRARTRRDRRG